MPSITKSPAKVECVNPNTGSRMNIDGTTYELFSKAIYHLLKAGKELTFTQITEGIAARFEEQKTSFHGSVEWYTVTVKNDMQSRGIIEAILIKGKKLHRLRNRK